MFYFKLFLVAAIVVLVNGGHHHHHHHHPVHYKFAYFVHDPHTHDIKEQHEERHGDKVKGHYSLHEPDGTKRIVHYSADHHGGFHAHVEHKGHAVHPPPHHHHKHHHHHHHEKATSHISFVRHH